MKFYLVMLSIFLFFSLFLIDSEATPSCTFRSDVCNSNEKCLIKVFQENNTHVGSCDSNYPITVCCTELATNATIRSSCNADEGGIISMYQTSNSHAGRKDYYGNIVCAKNTTNPILATMRSSCLARESCAFTVFQQNNTHVGRCNYYSTSVCIQQNFNVTITMILNVTEPNWNEDVMLEGNATRADDSDIDTSADADSDVEVYLNSSKICTTETNSAGRYTCNFTAPLAVGLYELNVTVDDPTTGRTWYNTTTFNVKQQFGEAATTESTAESVACYEEPRIVQNPDGTIEVAIVRICVWK